MPQPSVLSIGNFDGVHRGHQAILARARRLADQHHARLTVLTFDPHPARTLRPGSEPPRLNSVHEKVDRLKAAHADRVVVLEPTPEMLSQSADQFIQRIVDEHHPVAIVEGSDFRFGKGRAGNMTLLRQLGQEHGFEAIVEPPVQVMLSDMLAAPVSSSLVRWLVGRGRVLDAGLCLGDPFELTGQVAAGEQRGRTLGIPTANLDPAAYADHIVPADGVYAGYVRLPPEYRDEPPRSYPAAISVGIKPTFGQHQLTVEAHLLDFQGDLYGRTITVQFLRWIRDQYAYPGLESLKRQLDRDILHTRHWHEQQVLTIPRQPPIAEAQHP